MVLLSRTAHILKRITVHQVAALPKRPTFPCILAPELALLSLSSCPSPRLFIPSSSNPFVFELFLSSGDRDQSQTLLVFSAMVMQRLADAVLGNAKESIKTFTQEAFQNAVRVINGFSALVLTFIPGKGSTLDGIESLSTFRGPRMPRWMEEGVSSFNAFLTEYDTDSEDSETEYESVNEDSDTTAPPSSSSKTYHLSRAGSTGKRHRRDKSLIRRLLLWMLWPLWLLCRIWRSGNQGLSRLQCTRSSSSEGLRRLASRMSGSKEFTVPKSVGDRRRGIIEDLQLVMELLIESVFEVVRNIVHHVLSPFNTLREFLHWAFFRDTSYSDDTSCNDGADLAHMSTLGDSDPHPQRQKKVSQQPLNTDNRTCQDIITGLGYPYEAYRVTTGDGYVLLLERIPRHDSQKVVFLQHGMLDSSLGWVSNGVVGSQAFAAFDQGYDVYLGNLRGLASREHVDKHISPRRYWNFSLNEHGTQDISHMITKIHELKMRELQPHPATRNGEISPHSGSRNGEILEPVDYNPKELPYRLCGVAHSMGGAAILIYVVTKRLANLPHYMSRLILLSPAGFHDDGPIAIKVLQRVIPLIAWFLCLFMPGLYIPTRFFRGLFNKLSRDFQNYPAVGGLAQATLSYLIGGDSSNWLGAIGVTHYNINNMPGLAVRVCVHFCQLLRANRFIMYDFGCRELNFEAYGIPSPIDIGANYGLIDIPVDVVAGRKDRLIPSAAVKRHFDIMEAAGCQASFSEFEFAHLDFTFANREELMAYVTSRLSLVAPVPGNIIEPLEETPSSRRLTGVLSSRQAFRERRNGSKSFNGELLEKVIGEESAEVNHAVESSSRFKLKST